MTWIIYSPERARSNVGYSGYYDVDYELYAEGFASPFTSQWMQYKFQPTHSTNAIPNQNILDIQEIFIKKYENNKESLTVSFVNKDALKNFTQHLQEQNIPYFYSPKIFNSREEKTLYWETKKQGRVRYMSTLENNEPLFSHEQLVGVLKEINKFDPFTPAMKEQLRKINFSPVDLTLKNLCLDVIQGRFLFFSEKIKEPDSLPQDLLEEIQKISLK